MQNVKSPETALNVFASQDVRETVIKDAFVIFAKTYSAEQTRFAVFIKINHNVTVRLVTRLVTPIMHVSLIVRFDMNGY